MDQFADLRWMCLHIIIHTKNKISLRVVECGHQRIMLAKIAQQIDSFDIFILFSQLFDLSIRIIFWRSIVYQDKFTVISVHFFEFFHHHLYNLPNRCFGIVAWDDN